MQLKSKEGTRATARVLTLQLSRSSITSAPILQLLNNHCNRIITGDGNSSLTPSHSVDFWLSVSCMMFISLYTISKADQDLNLTLHWSAFLALTIFGMQPQHLNGKSNTLATLSSTLILSSKIPHLNILWADRLSHNRFSSVNLPHDSHEMIRHILMIFYPIAYSLRWLISVVYIPIRRLFIHTWPCTTLLFTTFSR